MLEFNPEFYAGSSPKALYFRPYFYTYNSHIFINYS